MKKIQFLNKKAIVTSLLVCTILVLVSIAVPATNGSFLQNAIDKREKIKNINFDLYELISSNDEITFDKLLVILKKEIHIHKGEILFNFLNILNKRMKQQLGNEWDVLFQHCCKQFINKMDDFQGLTFFEYVKNLFSLVKELKTSEESNSILIAGFNSFIQHELIQKHEKIIQTNSNNGLGFDDYWEQYLILLDIIKPYEYHEMMEWQKDTKEKLAIIEFTLLVVGISLIILAYPFIEGVAYLLILPVFMASALVFIYWSQTVHSVYTRDAYIEWSSIRLKVNVTDPYNNPIPDLDIYAISLDVLEKEERYHDTFNCTLYEFTEGEYYSKYADENEIIGPPLPPGNWMIHIDSQHGYDGKTIKTNEIRFNSFYEKHVILYKEHPYILEKFPLDGDNGILPNPTLYVEVIVYQNDNKLENVTFYERYDGNWIEIEKYENINDESGIFSAQPSHMNGYGQTYRWKVVAYDELDNPELREFSFTTTSAP